MRNRIEVRATGSQAPYGIGETVITYPHTIGGLKKAWKKAHETYIPMTIIVSGYRDNYSACAGDIGYLADTYQTGDGLDFSGLAKAIGL